MIAELILSKCSVWLRSTQELMHGLSFSVLDLEPLETSLSVQRATLQVHELSDYEGLRTGFPPATESHSSL